MVTTKESVGSRIRKYREDKGMSATELADKACVSKSYLSELESTNGEGKKPSAEVIYEIASALGVAMSDLLGRPIITDANRKAKRPPSLVKFGKDNGLPEADMKMLEQIEFRGEPPKSAERWAFIYQAIKGSESMDS
jgi:transcriptional regulator with XRE-family HTH domain